MEAQTLKYNRKLRSEFREGILQKKWRRRYNHIFDGDDLRLALSQPLYHFAEWFVAIHYAKKGYGVLVEKYIYKNHPRKLKTLSYILTAKGVEYLKKGRKKRKCQPPDLFVYKDKKFFFVEVKMDTDRLRKPQKEFFNDIEKKLGCEVRVCDLKAADRK